VSTIPAQTAQQQIAARIERLPLSPWHVKMRVIIGTATFFDAFDALAIAYVLPVLIPLWKLDPGKIGLLIAAGFAGQLAGALFFGSIAESQGRVRSVTWSIGIFAVMGFACAFAWNLPSMMFFRFVQGLGLGGEVPVAAAYINEFAKAQQRGRFFLLYECIFPVGLVAVAIVARWVVPNFGWQWMFIIGAVPAVLALVLRRLLPESPRWLASRGRIEEADKVMAEIERRVSEDGRRPLPPPSASVPQIVGGPARWRELFTPTYLRRTLSVWVMWFCTYLTTYGLGTWLPTIYRTVYKLPVQTALTYTLTAPAIGLVGALACAFLIDRVGRRLWFGFAFLFGALPLGALAAIGTPTAENVLWLASGSYAFISTLSLGLYLYTAEIYPTRVRALGTSTATAWLRIASMLGPPLVGAILPVYGIGSVFFVFAAAAVIGAVIAFIFTVESTGRMLEEVSP
jgi:putative MFS transporter